jgi:hypothetical protein
VIEICATFVNVTSAAIKTGTAVTTYYRSLIQAGSPTWTPTSPMAHLTQLSNDLLLYHVTEYLKMSLPLLPFSFFLSVFFFVFLSLSQPPTKVVQPNFLTAELYNEDTLCPNSFAS